MQLLVSELHHLLTVVLLTPPVRLILPASLLWALTPVLLPAMPPAPALPPAVLPAVLPEPLPALLPALQ
jgi:hypothetical protein